MWGKKWFSRAWTVAWGTALAATVAAAGKTKEIREGNTIGIATTDARTTANAAHGNAHLKHVLNRKKLVVLGTAAGVAAAALAAIGLAQATRQVSPVTPGP